MLDCQAFATDVKREPTSPGPVIHSGDSRAAAVGVEPGQVSPRRSGDSRALVVGVEPGQVNLRSKQIPAQFSRDFSGQAAGTSSRQGIDSSFATIPPLKARGQWKWKWELHEIKILIAAKKLELERRTKINSGTKWTAIADYVREHGVTNPIRDSNMCKKKWNKLLGNWRKVIDYERDKVSRHKAYHHMSTDERKEAALPIHFNDELFEEIREWYAAAGVEFPTIENGGPKDIPQGGQGVNLDDNGGIKHFSDPHTPRSARSPDAAKNVSQLPSVSRGSSAGSPDAAQKASQLPSVSRGRKQKSRSVSGEGSIPERSNLPTNEALIDVIARGIETNSQSLRLIAEAGSNCAAQMGRIADAGNNCAVQLGRIADAMLARDARHGHSE